MGNRTTTEICELLAPIVAALGYELWGCELIGQGKHTVLRVYIDAEGGVMLDDCAKASSQISGILDVEDLIAGQYDLEVSSPGMDRLLFTAEQFEKYVGSEVKIRLHTAENDRRNYVGEIKAVELDNVTILVDDDSIVIPIENIDKARIVPKF